MKKISFAICISLLAMLIFSGCSDLKELNSAMNEAATADEISTFGLKIEQNKTTKSEIFKAIGAPGLVFQNELDGESWVYPRIAARRTDLGFQARGNFAAIFPYTTHSWSKGGGVAGVGAASKLSSRNSSYKTAGLLIKFNNEGNVSSYEFTATSF